MLHGHTGANLHQLGAQFESQLMTELCQLWRGIRMHTTPYHLQFNGVVELPSSTTADLMSRVGRVASSVNESVVGNTYMVTGEMVNLLMLGWESCLPDQLEFSPPPTKAQHAHKYVVKILKRLEKVHAILREEQAVIRQEDWEEPSLYAPGNWIWLLNERRKQGDNPKLEAKFVRPDPIINVLPKHTCLIERQGQS